VRLRAARDQHVFEVLAGAAAGASVHVTTVGAVETETCALEDLRVEPATIVDDNEDGCARTERFGGPLEHRRHAVRVGGDGGPARAGGGCTQLALAAVVEAEQLVGVNSAARGSRSGRDTAAT
jgi:hypothetical protein